MPWRSLICAAAAALACGQPQRHFELQLASGAASGSGALPVIRMQTGETRIVTFMPVGDVPADVAWSATNLPSFATLDGPLLTLTPARPDAGETVTAVTAKARDASATTSFRIVVERENASPTWNPLFSSYPVADDLGWHHAMVCPGSRCTLIGTPVLWASVCDPDGDAVTLEVEVVARGAPFSGNATHVATLPRLNKGSLNPPTAEKNCADLMLPLKGLQIEGSYAYAMRVVDEFGAAPAVPAVYSNERGWWQRAYEPFEFDVGPCATRACACVPAKELAESVAQCCSGLADPYTGPWYGFVNWTCR